MEHVKKTYKIKQQLTKLKPQTTTPMITTCPEESEEQIKTNIMNSNVHSHKTEVWHNCEIYRRHDSLHG